MREITKHSFVPYSKLYININKYTKYEKLIQLEAELFLSLEILNDTMICNLYCLIID